ncbi:MAG: nitrile hydratase subunit alpha [Alphaproteobacteria bacterium]|nr:nitrile hydratase subunit alpha [Alphaproteobacteria bacterium]
MTTPFTNPLEGMKLESTGSGFSRRNLLVAGATAAMTPAISTGVMAPVAAQAQTLPQRFGYPANREILNAARAKALESLLIEKGIITGKSVDGVLSFFETQMGPFNGAKVVARAWVDEAFKKRLAEDTPAAIASMDLPKGMAGAEGEHMRAAVNTPTMHNLVICTLCSCYPWPVLGLPPYWYKDPTFRARAAREPREVLKEFGLAIPDSVEIKTWDSSAQIRWFVVPNRPAGTEDMSEADLAKLVTAEGMMGVAKV